MVTKMFAKKMTRLLRTAYGQPKVVLKVIVNCNYVQYFLEYVLLVMFQIGLLTIVRCVLSCWCLSLICRGRGRISDSRELNCQRQYLEMEMYS